MDKIKQSFISYFLGVRAEWGKINWPEKQQVVAQTIFAVVIIGVFTISVYLIDVIYKVLLGLLPNS